MPSVKVLETPLAMLPLEGRAYLQAAYDRMSREESLESFVSTGTIYTIYLDDVVTGAMYLKILQGVIGIELFGCDNFEAIKDCFSDFAADLCRLNNVNQIFFTGRAGFYKKLPEFECLGTIYRYALRGGTLQ